MVVAKRFKDTLKGLDILPRQERWELLVLWEYCTRWVINGLLLTFKIKLLVYVLLLQDLINLELYVIHEHWQKYCWESSQRFKSTFWTPKVSCRFPMWGQKETTGENLEITRSSEDYYNQGRQSGTELGPPLVFLSCGLIGRWFGGGRAAQQEQLCPQRRSATQEDRNTNYRQPHHDFNNQPSPKADVPVLKFETVTVKQQSN